MGGSKRLGRIVAVTAVLATAIAGAPAGPAPAGAQMAFPTSDDFADALGVFDFELNGFSLGGSGDGIAILSEEIGDFPTEGDEFLVLSTGRATDTTLPNNSGSLGTILDGPNNSQGNDFVQINFDFRPLLGPNQTLPSCVSFDFKFLSEEFPEFVGSSFNDAFTAEAGVSELSIVGNSVVAPRNFARDENDNPISVNTAFGLAPGTESTFDGATPTLTARTPYVSGGSGEINLFLTIQDLGDSRYDSAVFIDNVQWEYGTTCQAGVSLGDSDGDGLLDSWETDGIDFDNDGTIDLDLPAMGATPDHKDLFIEADWMRQPGEYCFGICFKGGHSHEPPDRLQQVIIEAFAIAPVSNPDGVDGIRVHFDAGPDTIMNPDTGETWGDRSRANELVHEDDFGILTTSLQYIWSDLATSREANFEAERRPAFRYMTFVHDAGQDGDGLLGIARGIPGSDVIIFDNQMDGDSVTRTATTMHEFGHSLGLFHGGDQPGVNGKPNYISVMNYSFSFDGLTQDGRDSVIDFSRTQLPNLDETNLNEAVGVTLPLDFESTYYCGFDIRNIGPGGGPVDWDCDGNGNENGVVANVNAIPGFGSVPGEILTGYDDWSNLRFEGGAVGLLIEPDLPSETPADEAVTAAGRDALPRPYAVGIAAPEDSLLPSSAAAILPVEITNLGDLADTIDVEFSDSAGWLATSSAVAIPVAAGETVVIDLVVAAPATAGSQTEIAIVATSQGNPGRASDATLRLEVQPVSADQATSLLAQAVDTIDSAAFASPGNYNAFATQVDRALADLESGRTKQGERTLTNLIKRFDGCASPTGSAANNDWLTDCVWQYAMRSYVSAILN